MSKMTVERMKEIIMSEVPFSELQKNKGIFEFHEENSKSLGVSYEDIDDKKDVYIYNIFLGEEYLNICGEGTMENPLPDEIVGELVEEWNKYDTEEIE